ncbi:AraC family transcriptional regulator [Sphingobium aromaticiconvertens]|uniref:helix-turn-helix domain-containing protein n=1 Tax=Sphingobium aromaticiconvertens TaxID=365341 RepID=UPI003019DDE2
MGREQGTIELPVMAGAAVADDRGALSYKVDGAQGPVRLRYFAPPAAVRPYFGSIYIFTVDAEDYADVTRADVPQLRFMLAGEGRYHFQDGANAATPRVCLLGPTLGATRFVLQGPARVVGVSLLPAGWMVLHGVDTSMMADRLCDMVADHGQDYTELLEALQDEALDDDAIVAMVWAFLAERIEPLPPATWRLLEAVDHWLTDEPSPRVEVLAQATGVSARQLARLTNRFYGAPPKLLARKYRALRCSARIAIDRESWQALCDDGTFYDQSHFIREIKHFIGLTPHQLLSEPSAVAQLTLLRRSLGGDVVALNRVS